jgi:hypothetical protein
MSKLAKDSLAHEVNADVAEITVGEILEYGDMDFFFPYQWSCYGHDGIGGKATDPLTIYASIDVDGCDSRVTFKTTVRELLEDTIVGYECVNQPGYIVDKKGRKILEDMRDSLIKEAKYIDEWLSINGVDDYE